MMLIDRTCLPDVNRSWKNVIDRKGDWIIETLCCVTPLGSNKFGGIWKRKNMGFCDFSVVSIVKNWDSILYLNTFKLIFHHFQPSLIIQNKWFVHKCLIVIKQVSRIKYDIWYVEKHPRDNKLAYIFQWSLCPKPLWWYQNNPTPI